MTKPFITAFVKDLEGQVSRGEISYSRMVELLNEKAISWASSQDGWVDVKTELPKCEEQHRLTFSSGKLLVYTNEGIDIDEYLKHYKNTEKGLKLFSEEWSRNDTITHWKEVKSPQTTKQ